ncbi:MAG: TIGR02391 family protein [Reyranellaceae bacterium]
MPERFEPLRARVNHALAFVGIVVHESGELEAVAAASTLSEAEARASELRTSLVGRHLHPDVVSFCRAELVQKNYFHAVFEATKSVAAKLRKLTGLSSDGHELVQSTLEGDVPLLAINNLSKPSERTEQRGFANLLKGIFSMFRNPLAHEPKVEWEVSMRDAEDLMGTLSLIHRRLDAAKPNTFGGRLRD